MIRPDQHSAFRGIKDKGYSCSIDRGSGPQWIDSFSCLSLSPAEGSWNASDDFRMQISQYQ